MNQDNETPSPWAERVLLPILLAFAAGVMVMDIARDGRDADPSVTASAQCVPQSSERTSLRAERPQTAYAKTE